MIFILLSNRIILGPIRDWCSLRLSLTRIAHTGRLHAVEVLFCLYFHSLFISVLFAFHNTNMKNVDLWIDWPQRVSLNEDVWMAFNSRSVFITLSLSFALDSILRFIFSKFYSFFALVRIGLMLLPIVSICVNVCVCGSMGEREWDKWNRERNVKKIKRYVRARGWMWLI